MYNSPPCPALWVSPDHVTSSILKLETELTKALHYYTTNHGIYIQLFLCFKTIFNPLRNSVSFRRCLVPISSQHKSHGNKSLARCIWHSFVFLQNSCFVQKFNFDTFLYFFCKISKYSLFNSNMNYSIFFACFLMGLETVFTTSITMETLFTLETFFTREKCFYSDRKIFYHFFPSL